MFRQDYSSRSRRHIHILCRNLAALRDKILTASFRETVMQRFIPVSPSDLGHEEFSESAKRLKA